MKLFVSIVAAILCLSFLQGSQAEPKTAACDLCKQVITAIDEFLTDGSTEQDIIDYLTGVTSFLKLVDFNFCFASDLR